MYCEKCGKKIKDTDKFCYFCGYELQHSISNRKSNKHSSHKKKGLLIGIIVLIIVINPLSWFSSSKSYEKVVDEYVHAMMSGSAKKVASLIHDDYIDVFIDYGAFSNKSEMIKYMQENLDDTMDRLNNTYGKGWEYDYYITDTYLYSPDDIEFAINYAGYEFADVYYEAEEVIEVDINVTRSGNKYTDSSTTSIILLNINSKWYTTMETW